MPTKRFCWAALPSNLLRHGANLKNTKTVILAGGLGSRLSEETDGKPKPMVEIGDKTMTGGRLKRVGSYLKGEESFCMTYGDGVADVEIAALVDFHRAGGRMATMTAVRPFSRLPTRCTMSEKARFAV